MGHGITGCYDEFGTGREMATESKDHRCYSLT